MSWLKKLLGPSRKAVWRRLSEELGGQFHEGGFFSQHTVQARSDDWTITLDTVTQGNGKTSETFTRLRAPYFNPEGFRVEIYRASLFSGVGKSLGMQDIEVGHPGFDRDFVIKSNEPRRVRRLLDNDKIRGLIAAQPKIRLSVKGHDGWFGKFPAEMDELHFQAVRVIKDLAQLKALFELFAEALRHLCHEGQAYEDDVQLHMRRIRAPGGQIKDGHILWEGDEPRRAAAVALGRLGDPAAVPALASVLNDQDTVLRAQAIEALVKIAHQDAIGPLVRRLVDPRKANDAQPIRERIAEALRQLDEGELVDTVLEALSGEFGRLKASTGEYRAEIIETLGNAISLRSGTHPANALAAIHAVEALPRLREVLRNVGAQNPTGQAVSAAIKQLEARASLPRAASAADAEVDTLPRAAREPGPDSGTLPRGSRGPER